MIKVEFFKVLILVFIGLGLEMLIFYVQIMTLERKILIFLFKTCNIKI
jgi:hypothetical protein